MYIHRVFIQGQQMLPILSSHLQAVTLKYTPLPLQSMHSSHQPLVGHGPLDPITF